MTAVFRHADQLLRGTGPFGVSTGPRSWWLVPSLVLVFAPMYGAVMGAYAFDSPERALQVLFSAVKLPLLLLTSTVLCLPAFFVLSSVLGLRDDIGASLRAILAGQGVMSIALAALAPATAFFYANSLTYGTAKLVNGGMFALATLAAQVVIRRHYRPLVARNRNHAFVLAIWGTLYVFVGIQMGWTLRPFIGQPGMATTFFREGALTNAYVEVAQLIGGAVRGVFGSLPY
jgi:hypothetical protein